MQQHIQNAANELQTKQGKQEARASTRRISPNKEEESVYDGTEESAGEQPPKGKGGQSKTKAVKP